MLKNYRGAYRAYNWMVAHVRAQGCKTVHPYILDDDEYCVEFVADTYVRRMNECIRSICFLNIEKDIIQSEGITTNKRIKFIDDQIAYQYRNVDAYKQRSNPVPTYGIDMLQRYARRYTFFDTPTMVRRIVFSDDRFYIVAKRDASKKDLGQFDLLISMDCDYDYIIEHIGDIVPGGIILTDENGAPKYNIDDETLKSLKAKLRYETK